MTPPLQQQGCAKGALNGVQVVGGSNPPCPTRSNPHRKSNLAAAPSPPHAPSSESNDTSIHVCPKRFGSPFLKDLHRFCDDEFRWSLVQ